MVDELCERVVSGDLRALARAATLVEARSSIGRELIRTLFSKTGRAKMIGITGAPGAGKSTLVSELARVIRLRGETVGIIAVDPSSPFSKGALMGDRIRMQEHHADPGVFIRSMATRGKLGGLAQATLDLALLFDAAGRDFVLIETVGVGQGEVEIARLADVTLLVLTPGMGDDVQAVKAGIMEVADVFVINKADRPGVNKLENEIRAMQSLGDERAAAAPVKRVEANRGEGVTELLAATEEILARQDKAARLREVWSYRLSEMIRERVVSGIDAELVDEHAARVAEKIEDPYAAVDAVLGGARGHRD